MRLFNKYDRRRIGNIKATFTRGKTTVDGAGVAVAANDPRFDGTTRAVASLIDWKSTGYVAGASPYLMASGNDLDGTTRLIVVREDAGTTLRVCIVDDQRLTVRQQSSTSWNSFPGGGGAVAYTPKSAQVIDGTILVYLQRTTSGVYDGVTFAYSQDMGATWTRITNSSTDGGGTHMSSPASYGASANAVTRGDFWSTGYTPHGGLDANGRALNENRVWFTWVDYLIGNAATKGFDMGCVELTRTAPKTHFTVGVNRRLHSGYYASQTNNLHAHSLGLTGNGLFITNIGDGIGKASCHTIQLDLDTYATASITVTEVFGELTNSAAVGRQSPQLFGGIPAPNGDVFFGNDTWHSPVMRVSNMTTHTDPFKLNSPLYVVDDANTGNYFRGWEMFNVRRFPNKGWTIGPDSTKNGLRLISYDGINWAWMNNTDGIHAWQNIIVGDCIAGIDTNDMLMLAPLPKIMTTRPLMVAPGADNYLHNTTNLYQAVAPTSPNTLRRALWSGGQWIFQDTSLPISNAPKTPPANINDGVGIYMGNESAASPVHGWLYLPDTADTITISTNSVGVPYAIANLGTNATGWFSTKVGSDGIGANCTSEQGTKPDRSGNADDPWCYGWVWGNPANNPTSARAIMYLQSGPDLTTANVSCPQLLVLGGLYLGEHTPWPCSRDSTSNSHEKEILFIDASPTSSTTWKGTVTLIRSDVQASIANKLPSGPLFTWWKDASNFIAVTLDGPNWELEIQSTVATVAQTAQAIAIEDWFRGSPLSISITDNGTDVFVSIVSPRNGVQTATLATDSIGYPTQLLFGDATQANVSNTMVAAVEFQDRTLTLQQMAEEHVSGSYLFSDDELTAEVVAKSVEKQLTSAFASLPTNVWAVDDTQVRKTGTTGLRLTRLPNANAAAVGGLPTVDASNRIVGIQGTITTLDGLDTAQDTQHSTTQGRLPASLVSGRIDASVGAMAANTLTATAIASDAITAAKVAADVTTEIQSGLATASELSTVSGKIDVVDDLLDTEVAAIKTVVDAIVVDTVDIQGRLPAALVSGRIDASAGAIAANVITAASTASDYVTEVQSGLATASALATVESKIDTIDTNVDALPTTVSEALFKLDLSTLTGEASRSLLNGIRFLRNKWAISGTTLTVYKEDDTTSAWTSTISSSTANPITGNDPA